MFRIKYIICLFCIFLANCTGDDYYNLGVYEAKEGNHEKAIEYFSKAIEKNPKDNNAYFNRAYSQQLLGGKEKKVIADYSKSLKLNPNDNEAYMNRGIVFMEIGEIDNAISDFKKSIKLVSDYASAYLNLGNAYLLKNDLDNACINWKISTELGNEKAPNLIKINCNKNGDVSNY